MKADSPALAKLGVVTKSHIKVKFVIVDTTVEHIVIQNASLIVKPSLTLCWTPKVVRVTTFIISGRDDLYYLEAQKQGNHHVRSAPLCR
jgi:hypothetical protein